MPTGSGIEYKIEGVNQTLQFFQSLPENLNQLIDDILITGMTEISGDAQEAVPTPDRLNQGPDEGGRLKASIAPYTDGPLQHGVAAGMHYAAYVEFGTRPLVMVPPELTDYAMQFIGAGPPDVATVPSPYLYPAFNKHVPQIIEQITNEINNELQPPEV